MLQDWLLSSKSKDTLELRDVIAGGVDIWAFEYPSYYKGEDKKAFEQKVTDHFYTREIGAETVGRWLLYFRRTMREIMPYYIQRYESVELMKDPEIRPLDNYNMIEEFTEDTTGTSETNGKIDVINSGTDTSESSGTSETSGTAKGNGTKTTNGSEKHVKVHSDTPQGEINMNFTTGGSVVNLSYGSDTEELADVTTSSETSTANEETTQNGSSSDKSTRSHAETRADVSEETGKTTGKTTHSLTRRGNIGVTTYAQLLEGYRETFLNIDMEIINELESCFMGVF